MGASALIYLGALVLATGLGFAAGLSDGSRP